MADRRRTWAGCVARNALDAVPGLVKLISGIRDWYAQRDGIVGRTEHWWYGVTLREEIGWTQLVDREEAVGRFANFMSHQIAGQQEPEEEVEPEDQAERA